MPVVLKSGMTGEALVEAEDFPTALNILLNNTLPPDAIFQIVPDSPNSALIVRLSSPAEIAYIGPTFHVPHVRPRPAFDPSSRYAYTTQMDSVLPTQCLRCLSICSSAGWTHNQWRALHRAEYAATNAFAEVTRNGQTGSFLPGELGDPVCLTGVDGTDDFGGFLCHACAPDGQEYDYSCFKCKKPYFKPRPTLAQMLEDGFRSIPTRGEPVAFLWCPECVDAVAVIEISSDSD